MNNHTVYDIAFTLEENIHTADRISIFKNYKDTEELYKSREIIYSEVTGRKITLSSENIEKAKYLQDFIYKSNIKTVLHSDTLFPELLTNITDPPYMLYLRGNEKLLSDKKVSIVGTRTADDQGKIIALDISQELSKLNFTLVSGLAKGIDSIVHTTAINSEGKTIAVIGCGIDITYPAAAKKTVKRMLETGNLIISEYPPSVKPYKHHFPVRNRIIAGLSNHTILVQSPLKSGSRITASLAGEYGRELLVFNPGNNKEGYEGNAEYINSIPEENIFSTKEQLCDFFRFK